MSHTTAELKSIYPNVNTANVPLNIFLLRVMQTNWDVMRAGSTPYQPRKGTLVDTFKTQYEAIEHPKVGFDVFCRRMRAGYDLDDAAKLPKQEPGELHRYYKAHQDPKVTYNVFFNRVTSRGWDKEEAITTPSKYVPRATAPVRKNRTFLHIWYTNQKHRAAVGWKTFKNRIELGWERERALLTPLTTEARCKFRQFYNTYPNPKVCYATFRKRVESLHWHPLEAISQPSATRKRSV